MLSSVFYYIKTTYKRQKKYIGFFPRVICFFAALSAMVLLSGCQTQEDHDENARFEAYTRELFCREVSANTVSLHYTLKEPEKYGIEKIPVTFGSFDVDAEAVKASSENIRQVLLDFEYDELDTENKLTYDILNYQLRMMKENADYILYEEPLSLVSGIQTQLPGGAFRISVL